VDKGLIHGFLTTAWPCGIHTFARSCHIVAMDERDL
jgi:hypothetical protein